jgi:chromosome partitioning protein
MMWSEGILGKNMADTTHWAWKALTTDTLEAAGLALGFMATGVAVDALRRKIFDPKGPRPPVPPQTTDTGIEHVIRVIEQGHLAWAKPVLPNPPLPTPVPSGGLPIITLANLKGGVGKTTITANLAGYFHKRGKRCLLIDMDYQGSLTTTILSAAAALDRRTTEHNTEKLLGEVPENPDGMLARVMETTIELSGLMSGRIAPAFYELQTHEDAMLVRWVAGLYADDPRYRLCRLLQSTKLKQICDLVLIDAPPRMTAGFVNALCASTHLFIPTILDPMSAEAAILFARRMHKLRPDLCPNLFLGGVIASRSGTLESGALKDRETEVADMIDNALRPLWNLPAPVLRDVPLPSSSAFSGEGIEKISMLGHTIEPKNRVRALGDRVATLIGMLP